MYIHLILFNQHCRFKVLRHYMKYYIFRRIIVSGLFPIVIILVQHVKGGGGQNNDIYFKEKTLAVLILKYLKLMSPSQLIPDLLMGCYGCFLIYITRDNLGAYAWFWCHWTVINEHKLQVPDFESRDRWELHCVEINYL